MHIFFTVSFLSQNDSNTKKNLLEAFSIVFKNFGMLHQLSLLTFVY